jgi:hypothetical protein
VVPVTVDPPAADESSAVLDADLTVLGHKATVWGGLAVLVPFMVFELLIGVVAAEIVAGGLLTGASGIRARSSAASRKLPMSVKVRATIPAAAIAIPPAADPASPRHVACLTAKRVGRDLVLVSHQHRDHRLPGYRRQWGRGQRHDRGAGRRRQIGPDPSG